MQRQIPIVVCSIRAWQVTSEWLLNPGLWSEKKRGDEFQRLAAKVHREVLRFNQDSVYLSSSLEKCRREWLREGSDSCTPFHGVLAIELFLNVMTSYITMVTLVIIAFSLNMKKTRIRIFVHHLSSQYSFQWTIPPPTHTHKLETWVETKFWNHSLTSQTVFLLVGILTEIYSFLMSIWVVTL